MVVQGHLLSFLQQNSFIILPSAVIHFDLVIINAFQGGFYLYPVSPHQTI